MMRVALTPDGTTYREWRTSLGLRLLAVLAAGIALVMNRLAFHPRLVVDRRDVLIVNPISTHRVPLNRICLAEPTYDGLRLVLDDGTAFAAWAVQTTNL